MIADIGRDAQSAYGQQGSPGTAAHQHWYAEEQRRHPEGHDALCSLLDTRQPPLAQGTERVSFL